ncbi:MAG: hypothetical protein ACE5EQ_08210 [Phycisphaerae bacterium]
MRSPIGTPILVTVVIGGEIADTIQRLLILTARFMSLVRQSDNTQT